VAIRKKAEHERNVLRILVGEARAMADHLNEVAVWTSENLDMSDSGSYGSGLGPGIIGLFDEYYSR
jgi:hypothetical protein